MRRILYPLAASLLCPALARAQEVSPAPASQAAQNAVMASVDAFGVTVGNETIGLYSPTDVRGFSALSAGNARLDGLYFDPLNTPSQLLVTQTTIRVGVAAQGFPFPAPTGVVDYTLRRPDDTATLGLFSDADTYGNTQLEANASVPLAPGWSAGLGGDVGTDGYFDGTADRFDKMMLSLRYHPSADFDVFLFFTRTDLNMAVQGPIYLPDGNFVPDGMRRRSYFGPGWDEDSRNLYNYGGIATWRPSEGLRIDAGLFHSEIDERLDYQNLYVNLTRAGVADQQIIVQPPSTMFSDSGEFRVTRSFATGALRHSLLVSLRGRLRDATFGGSDTVDLGSIGVQQMQDATRPAYSFTQKDRDRIEQGTVGIGYVGEWPGVGAASLSLSRTSYAKTATAGAIGALAETEGHTVATPFTPAAAVRLDLTPTLALYASATRGLEDAGDAPPTAANRNEPLTAIISHQHDAGLRWKATRKLSFVVGVFDIAKPYYTFNTRNVYAIVGNIDIRGVETSVSGALTPSLNMVAGAVLADPRATGGAAYGVGGFPVGQPHQLVTLNLDWSPGFLARKVTLDGAFTYQSTVAATNNDRVHLGPQPIFEVGARYHIRLAGKPAQWRLDVQNLTNLNAFQLDGSGAYVFLPGRIVSISLGVDV
jgi:iron complex outermembrane receptor protein